MVATRTENDRALPGTEVEHKRRGRARRFLRGRPDNPTWVRPSLTILLVATGTLYMWDLGASGWANGFYAAAVQAGTKSWKAFLFGSFDPSNFITVDKSPGALWVMEMSGRIFGFNSWSMLLPEALEGVATVGLVYLIVRRWFPPGAGLAAAAVTALTPVAALMFRFNNPDALMVLLITLATYATVRAVDDGRARWMVIAGTAIGFAFLAKMLQSFLVVPALASVYLIAGPATVLRRIRHLLYGGAAIALAAGWWIALVQLTPAADRPYIGGSQDNSVWNLIFGYNGFGRLTGNETGSVGGGQTGTGGRWGATGLTRLFGAEMGTQVAWLLPAALLLTVVGLWVTRRASRTNRTRAALLLWGGWLVVTGLAFSLGQGIIHPYYTVALAPAIGGLIAVGGSLLWANRERVLARATMAMAILLSAMWSAVLLDRTPHWMPALRAVVLIAGALAAAGVAAGPLLIGSVRRLTAASAMVACLGAPLAYTLDTVNTPHSGSIPTAGPAGASTMSGPGGGPGGPGTFRFRGIAGAPPFATGTPGPLASRTGSGAGGGSARAAGAGAAGAGAAGAGTAGGLGAGPGAVGGGNTGNSAGGIPGVGNPGGGLLDASRPSSQLTALLEHDASRYEWVAAAVGANEAAGYQLATGDAVMALGGFNGTDPYPSLSAFEKLVDAGRVHYFIVSGGGFGPAGGPPAGVGPGGGTSGTGNAITTWVESHFQSQTVGGVTVYDLTAAK